MLKESCGRQNDVGVINRVSKKLLVHHGEKIGPQKAAHHIAMVGRHDGRIRVVNENRFYRRIVKRVQSLAQL